MPSTMGVVAVHWLRLLRWRSPRMHWTPASQPLLDLRAEPKQWAARTHVDDRLRHVWVATLIATHAVAVREAEELGDSLCVDEIFGPHGRSH